MDFNFKMNAVIYHSRLNMTEYISVLILKLIPNFCEGCEAL